MNCCLCTFNCLVFKVEVIRYMGILQAQKRKKTRNLGDIELADNVASVVYWHQKT